jgi:hypothetical protein
MLTRLSESVIMYIQDEGRMVRVLSCWAATLLLIRRRSIILNLWESPHAEWRGRIKGPRIWEWVPASYGDYIMLESMLKFEKNEIVKIQKFKGDPINEEGRISDIIISDGEHGVEVVLYRVTNLNMPFQGTVADFFTAPELEKR